MIVRLAQRSAIRRRRYAKLSRSGDMPIEHGEPAMMGGIGNFVAEVAGIACLVYAASLVVGVILSRAANTPPVGPQLPRAVAT